VVLVARNGKVALVDFDNTLFFTGKPTRLATIEMFGKALGRDTVRNMDRDVKRQIYELAHSKYKWHSTPHSFLIRRLKLKKGSKIVIMTARSVSLRSHTLDLIRKHGVRYDRLMLRDEKAMALKDEEWKLQQIKKFLKNYESVSYYDDKEENIAYVRKAIGRSKRLRTFQVLPERIREVKR
jgi:hypothetical protein